jgi:hypothetical protein
MAPLSSETKGGPLANGNSVQAAVNSWVCGQGSCCSARTHSHPPERSSTPIAAATFNHIAYRKDSSSRSGSASKSRSTKATRRAKQLRAYRFDPGLTRPDS